MFGMFGSDRYRPLAGKSALLLEVKYLQLVDFQLINLWNDDCKSADKVKPLSLC